MGASHQHFIIVGTMMMMMVMTMMVGVVVSQARRNVCNDSSDDRYHSFLRPRVSDEFRVDVECNLEEQNKTAYVKEYYDLNRNRGRITLYEHSGMLDYFMDYDQNLILQVEPANGKCSVGMLILSDDRLFFGYRMKNYNSQIFSPSGALHFSNANESYVGKTTVRGILVDHWRSCQYLQLINATAIVDWYFSRKDEWTMQLARAEASPIRMTAVGEMVTPDQNIHKFNHTYDFFNYLPRVDQSNFEIPDGVYCPGRDQVAKPKPFPQVPIQMFFIEEFLDPFQKTYDRMEEAYDNTTKTTAYRFTGSTSQLTGINQYLAINDYRTGVSYLIDHSTDSCTPSPIANSSMASSRPVNSNGQVRMETPKEWFSDFRVNYQYAGSTTVRNIPAERWVGTTTELSDYKWTNVTVEWYFLANDHYSWNDGFNTKSKYRTPLMSRIYFPDQGVKAPPFQTNLFYFNVMKPQFTLADISLCFKDTQRKTLRFSIPKSWESTVRNDIVQFKLAIQEAIRLHTGISAIRINNIQLFFNPQKVIVVFVLLDKPPHYNDVVGGLTQNSLSAALKLLRDAFADGTMTFDFALGTTSVHITPDMNSLEDITDYHGSGDTGDSSLYSAGAFAGLAVGMLVLGGIGGGTGAFFFFK